MNQLRRASIRTQVLVLALLLVVLVSAVAATTEPFVYGRHDKGVEIGLMAGRIERLVDQYRAARTPDEERGAVNLAARFGFHVEAVNIDQISAADREEARSGDLAARTRSALETEFADELRHLFDNKPTVTPLVVQVDEKRALVFQLPVFPQSLWFYPAVASGSLKILIPLIVLAYLSSWLIIRPVARFAAAAERASVDDSLEHPFVA